MVNRENAGGDYAYGYPGQDLGLPPEGNGSLAPVARRVVAMLIDWVICLIVANFINMFTHVLGGPSTLTLILWVILGILTGWLFARTPGMALLGMGVARTDEPGTRIGLWRAVVRTVLTAFIFPAVMMDENGMGMHDRGTGTAVIRTR